uniref:Cytochrome c oxidase subunit 2 n=1 Tax=Strigamia maritima TaxID=126957 RepID=A0A0C5AR19_STRMM|nr:cytochrome c oxidase subunit II [Strigamia maritima]AJK90873.1 cytochrome c oxidase subunit II [Strigamia maritima]
MSTWASLLNQDCSSPLMEQLIFFHDHVMMILTMITIMVMYMILALSYSPLINRFTTEGQEVEVMWTILPIITLVFIAFPSLRLLYLSDEVESPTMTIKTIGHQWYWSYEYSDFLNMQFDAHMTPQEELPLSGFRLLDVDNRTLIPTNTKTRVLMTAADVIQAWTVLALAVKSDAVPGRLNQVSLYITRPGLYTGQCSEICGANHSFMPIMIETTPINTLSKWIKSMS